MTHSYVLTPRALDDLDNIWNYISKGSVDAANRVESAIFASCEALARQPRMGTKHNEITPLPVRFWTITRYPNFVLVYRPSTNPLQVIAVLHHKQDIKSALAARGE